MKRLIFFVLACCFNLGALAANPSFGSFNTNQFDVTGNRVTIKDGASLTNIILFGSPTNLLEVWNSDNELKFWIDTNGFSHPDLWTNNAGTIQASSAVADGASAVAFRLGSSNALTAGYLAKLENSGALKASISFSGKITSGDSTNYSSMRYTEAVREADIRNFITEGANTWSQSINQYYAGTNAYQTFLFQRNSTYLTSMDPSGDLGGSSRYIFNTDAAVSSNDLLQVQNNGTSKFSVTWDGNPTSTGALIPSGNTNRITTAGGLLKLDGVAVPTYAGITNVETFALSDMTTALTTGTNKNYWYAPSAGMTIKFVRLTLATTSSSGTPTVDINEAGTSILSTKLTVDVGEWDSFTAAVPPVISDSAIAANAKIDFDIDVAGTGAAGAQVQIGFTVP